MVSIRMILSYGRQRLDVYIVNGTQPRTDQETFEFIGVAAEQLPGTLMQRPTFWDHFIGVADEQ